MPTLPKATTRVVDTAGAIASGTDTICVLAPVPTLDDLTPRLYGSARAIYDVHGYSEGVEYAAIHAARTGKPILFVGMPIGTPGAVVDEDVTGNSGTSVTTLTEGASGTLTEHQGVLSVITGGTIGTDQIVLGLSLDGGRTTRRVRLGTASSYAIPYVGLTIAFGEGTLIAGETIHTWDASGPLIDAADLTAARTALASQQRGFRTMLLIGDLADSTAAAALQSMIEAYETSNERFSLARASVREPGAGETTLPLWMAGIDADFESIDDAFRLSLAAGRARTTSPFSGWYFRRPIAWFISAREYQHDLHVATWRKSDGPLDCDLLDAEGNLAEWDDYVYGGAGVAARFTVARSWANGPQGTFAALDLTRANEASLLSYVHNANVVNLAQTICQAATENVIGRSLVLNDDGTATSDALSAIEGEVNASLELALLTDRGEGQRASKAVWTASKDDILNVPQALLTGVLELNLNGTIHSVYTRVRVISGGQ